MSDLERRIALGAEADKYLAEREERLKKKFNSFMSSVNESMKESRKAFWEHFIFWR